VRAIRRCGHHPPSPRTLTSVASPQRRPAPLHLGSLAAAVISWLDARSRGGRWHLRIDDVDRPRVVAGAADAILRTLDCFGLGWDGPVIYQSRNEPAYRSAASQLQSHGHAFPCACSRREVAAVGLSGWEGAIYPGTCRAGLRADQPARALRQRMEQRHWVVKDRALGPLGFDLHWLGGDFVIQRADGLFAYQLATVVDDLELGVTAVVRGIDLLGSVPRQLQLYQCLGQSPPTYLHHPVVVARGRAKLAKSSGAAPVRCREATTTLARVLSAIGIPVVECGFVKSDSVGELLAHAVAHWHPGVLPCDPIPEALLSSGDH
jgi:glutamyl-Q tRNA(Asp) synthetase